MPIPTRIRIVAFTLLALIVIVGVFPSGARADDQQILQPPYDLTADSKPQPGVPKGEMLQFEMTGSRLYPGTRRTIWVFVPAQYNPGKPACLCVGLDGPGFNVQNVFDNLIAKNQMPITIGVFVSSGTVNKPGSPDPTRFDRCFEFDSTNDRFVRFLDEEVLPAVKTHKTADGRAIVLSDDPNDHMIYGASSGGVCAFTAAWQRPDRYRRVFTAIGTYVGMRGADEYPTLVRKTEPKPIRLFLQDGVVDAWNPLFDSWYTQNRSMEESLSWAGYDVNHAWGTLGHDGTQAASIFPDVVRFLWSDYPAPITAGTSKNSMLKSVLAPGKAWELVNGDYKSPDSLTVGLAGELYIHDSGTSSIYRADSDGAGVRFGTVARDIAGVTASAVGPDGRLYTAVDDHVEVFDTGGKSRTIAKGFGAIKSLYVLSNNSIFVANDDRESTIWRIDPNGHRTQLDKGLHGASGIVPTPDDVLLFAAEASTHWIYSYVAAPDGTLQDKQRFYYLHTAETGDATDSNDEGSGATDMAEDRNGDLFVATRMGVQICDRNGRVEGILTLPAGPIAHLCFAGPNFDYLYVICAGRLYRRQLQIAGVPPWVPAMALPGFGGG